MLAEDTKGTKALMHTFGLEADKIPEIVVSRLSCRDFVVRLGLDRMNNVGKLDSVLDEEYWNIIADEIPISLLFMTCINNRNWRSNKKANRCKT